MKELVHNLLTNGHEVLGILLFLLHYIIIGLVMLGVSWAMVKAWEKISNFLF